jgi:2-polyprenyl-6-methoxyphenol hydroxylase-like FAD-dependent oxidoreductase
MNVGIVGGGPAGLFFAWLMKRHDASHRIRIVERDPADATYGWGVVFSDVALSFVRDIAPELHEDITRGQLRHDAMRIVHRGQEVMLPNNPFVRMARIDLLRKLRAQCTRLGIGIEYGRRVDALDGFADCDLVVAADGAGSAIRTRHADAFGPTLDVRPNWLAWYGTTRLFDPLSLIFRSMPSGLFIAHAYRYSATHSTFLVECDPDTFRAAGLERMSAAESLATCEDAFRDDLEGEPLLSNRSDWFRYAIVSNRRWHWRNVVLLGDALRTGHPSVGSGTRLAMQDAIALFEALAATPGDVPAALGDFEHRRRPGSDALQAAAIRSTEWYETVRDKLALDPVSFAYDYLRRTGRVSHEDVRARDPALAAAFEARHPEGPPP